MSQQPLDPSGSTEQFRAFVARQEPEPRYRSWAGALAAVIAVAAIAVLVFLVVT